MPVDLPRSIAAWSGAGAHVASRGLALLLSILLARTLGAQEYGIYAYAFALLSILLVFAQLGLPTFVLREITEARHQAEFARVSSILRSSQMLVVCAAMVVAVLGYAVLALWFDDLPRQRYQTAQWMLVSLPFVALAGVIAAAMRGMGLATAGLVLELVLRPAIVLALVLVVWFEAVDLLGPVTVMQLQLVAAVIVSAIGLIWLRLLAAQAQPGSPARFDVGGWAPSLLPLTLISGATLINSQADLVILGFFVEPAELGIYRVAVQLALLAGFALQVVVSVLAPTVARHRAAGNLAALQALVGRARVMITTATIMVALLLAGAGDRLVHLLFGAEYIEALLPLLWLVAGQVINAFTGPMGLVMNMCGHERRNSQLLLVSCGVNIALNVLMIPLFGLAGAAAATAIAIAGRSVAQWLYVRNRVWNDPAWV